MQIAAISPLYCYPQLSMILPVHGEFIMLESFINMVTTGVEAGASASHTPQTAIAAVLCAALVGLFS
ncbi:hypothetical protein CWS02_26320 [Enterobacter sp. EA-1]|nr:hypothetical protein CWS02_26320 [Enterobacter sp. EA-1]